MPVLVSNVMVWSDGKRALRHAGAVTASDEAQPHSAEWFGELRDYWWNRDQLELIAARGQLEDVRYGLDVGCGVGHWTFLVASLLAPESRLVGIDREAEWVREATNRSKSYGLAERISFENGDAGALSFGDSSFDLVTCQTLLIHVPAPAVVIGEMLRVARPGGVLLISEPNNVASFLVRSSVSADATVEDRLGLLRFALTCEHGKVALGEGDHSIGDLVPGYLARAGAVDIRVFMCDRALPVFPPYESEDQKAVVATMREQAAENRWVVARDQARRQFLAGGGTESEFDAAWRRRVEEVQRDAAALDDLAFSTAGGFIHYVILARKPC
jgi:SAM-dependent methyltransferase